MVKITYSTANRFKWKGKSKCFRIPFHHRLIWNSKSFWFSDSLQTATFLPIFSSFLPKKWNPPLILQICLTPWNCKCKNACLQWMVDKRFDRLLQWIVFMLQDCGGFISFPSVSQLLGPLSGGNLQNTRSANCGRGCFYLWDPWREKQFFSLLRLFRNSTVPSFRPWYDCLRW